uniref:KICSTOR subunit 2 n=1 Tax=Astyanax mexicanus TaxID=7994 RepID=A0A8B9JIY8_ASTMX
MTEALRDEELRPVPKERAILESFFTQLGMFSFDRAKDYVEKEKDSSKSAGAIWASLLAALAHLAAAEKAYHNMTFLGTMFILLKHIPINKLYTHFYGHAALMVTVIFISLSLCHRFHHPILSRLEGSFQVEVDVLTQLLRCQAQISEWHFLPSLLNLHGAHSKLQAWGQAFERQRETRKHLFGGQSQRAAQPPHLYLWLQRLQGALLAKFTFYFHEALSRQAPSAEMKALTARTSPDYFGKVSAFIRKHDASSVSLVFDNRGSESFQGHGYHHPHSYREAPKGVDQFPAVVSLPGGERPLTHWPNVIMIMSDRAAELNSLDKVMHFYDDKVQSTYFLARPEPHFTIVVIFDGRKSEKDSHVVAFLQEISTSLRNNKPFSTLKPGSKG